MFHVPILPTSTASIFWNIFRRQGERGLVPHLHLLFFLPPFFMFQKKKFVYRVRRNWMGRVILKTVSNIIHHWDYDDCKERMARPTATCTNPVVEKSSAVVLCLHCFGDNSECFTFCQHCGVANAVQPRGSAPARIFGSEGSFQFSPCI